jgi:outer membrane protein TolC
VDNGTFANGLGVTQVLRWGGSYAANWNNQRVTTTNLFSNFSPQLLSTVSFNFTQPLLRNLKIDQIREQVQLSAKARDLSDIQLRTVIAQTTRNVRNAYWDLAATRNNLAAQRQSLELAQQSLRDNQRRVDVGTMAPIDIIQAQAEVAINEQQVIVAEALIKSAEDRLRSSSTRRRISGHDDRADRARFQEQAIDVNTAVRNGLDSRRDISQARNGLDQVTSAFASSAISCFPTSMRRWTTARPASGISSARWIRSRSRAAARARAYCHRSRFRIGTGRNAQSAYPTGRSA